MYRENLGWCRVNIANFIIPFWASQHLGIPRTCERLARLLCPPVISCDVMALRIPLQASVTWSNLDAVLNHINPNRPLVTSRNDLGRQKDWRKPPLLITFELTWHENLAHCNAPFIMINFYSAVIVYRTVQDTILVSKSLQDTIKTIQHNLCNVQILQRGVLESPFNSFHHMQPTVFSVYGQGTTKTDTHMTLGTKHRQSKC